MTARARRVVGTAIIPIAVLAGAAAQACSADPPDAAPAIGLPARSRRDSDAADARSNVLEPAETGPVDSGPPPDPFCLEPGLVLCFTFDDAIENLAPTTPRLTPSKLADVTTAAGKKNLAAHFGVGSVFSFDDSPLLEMKAATVETWVNLDLASVGEDTVFDDDARFAMTIEADGTLRCNTATAIARGGKIPLETWTHIACVFDGTQIHAYVGGVEVASIAGSIGSSATTGAAIGDNAPDGGEGFTGELDSLRVFDVARSPAQIAGAAAP